jgi:Tfp pilus assembly protein PilX
MSRLRREDGIALPVAIMILAIVLLLVGVAVAYSVHSISRSNRDRASARALAAANAGLDTASWRMNKLLVGGRFTDLAGFTTQQLLTLSCLNVNVGTGTVSIALQTGSGWCVSSATDWEAADDQGGDGVQEEFRYYTNYGINLLSGSLVTRKVLSVGRSGSGGTRRYKVVLGKLTFTDSSDTTTLLPFKLSRFAECASELPSGSIDTWVSANCPNIGN